MKIKTNESLIQNQGAITNKIANFWDQVSAGWRQIWGPHIHHGFYENNQTITPLEAQEKLLEKLTAVLKIPAYSRILDVGFSLVE